MRFPFILSCAIACLFANSAIAASLKVAGKPDDNKLHLSLLNEIIKRSDTYDSLEFIYAKTGEPAGSRILADLESGALDISWTATSLELEQRFTPVRFPIYRGMLGMRLGLIHSKDTNMLAHVRSKSDLQSFKICSGKTWPDTFILDANGLQTAKSLKYPNIFDMLVAGNRCHLFGRGVMEPYSEVARHPHLPLAVDSHILIRYRMPYMLFVAKQNTQLAEHLMDIVEEIFNDGTYDTLFFNDDEVKTALSQAGLDKRTIIDLNNPYLTKETQAIPQHYFYDPLAQ